MKEETKKVLLYMPKKLLAISRKPLKSLDAQLLSDQPANSKDQAQVLMISVNTCCMITQSNYFSNATTH